MRCSDQGGRRYNNLQPATTSLLRNIIEAVVQTCSVKKVFLEISQNSLEISQISQNSPGTPGRPWHRCFPVNFICFYVVKVMQNKDKLFV